MSSRDFASLIVKTSLALVASNPMDITTDKTFFTLFPSPRNSITFTISFEGNLPHALHDEPVVSKLCAHKAS